jgi:cytochrome c
MGGPVFHRADYPKAKRPFPEYFDGKLIIGDLSRSLIMAVTLTADGAYAGMERFLPSYRPVEPIDMKFGPDGDLYVLEYGSNWFRKSDNARLVRIEYNAGNRAPVAKATASAIGGTVPFKVALSSKGSLDPDGDKLTYSWSVEPEQGGATRTFTTPDASVTFDKNGVYFATLTVTDPAGKTADQLVTIVAGNDTPQISFDVPGNRTFFFPDQPLKYAVAVKDKEDGVAPADRVAFSIDHVADNFDTAWLAQGDDPVDPSTRFGVAKALMAQSDCKTCHNLGSKSNGPAWTQVAEKYAGDSVAQAKLIDKIRGGGNKVWGETNMPAHPGLTPAEARSIIDYVMNIKSTAINTTPLGGTYPTGASATSGKIVLRAVYTDNGAGDLMAHTVEGIAVRRSPVVQAVSADETSGMISRMEANGGVETMSAKANGYLVFKNVDLTGIRELQIAAQAPLREGFKGGTLEVRLGSLVGELLGQATIGNAGAVSPDANAMQNAGGAPAPGAGGGIAAARIVLKNAVGQRDLYVIARNFSAKGDEMVLSIATITFVQ